MEYVRPPGSAQGWQVYRSIGVPVNSQFYLHHLRLTQLLPNMDLVDMLLSELEQDSGLRTPSPPSLSSTTPPPPSLPFSSSSPSCKSPPPPPYSTSPKEALQFPHVILSSTSSKELPAPSLNTSSPPPQVHCLTTNAGKIKQPENL